MPTPAELITFRSAITAFVDFTDAEWELFAANLYSRSISKRSRYIEAGTVCSEIGFITGGAFRFFVPKDGMEISNYFCFAGELVTAYASFLKRTPSLVSVEALEDSTLICFSHAGLQAMLADERLAFKMERFGRLVAEYLICCYEARVMSFITQSPEERYQQLLQDSPELLQRIPQHYIANFLGVTPVSLSRIRQRISAQHPATLKTAGSAA